MENNILLIPIAVFVIGITLWYTHKDEVRAKMLFRRENGDMAVTTTYTAMMLVWPVLFGMIVGWEKVQRQPIMSIAFFWPLLMIIWDMCSSLNDESMQEAEKKSSNTKINANVIVGASWAVGSLLVVITKSSTLPPEAARILLVSVVLCVAFVVPFMVEFDLRSPLARSMRSIQRTVMQYSIGLFIAGIALSWSS